LRYFAIYTLIQFYQQVHTLEILNTLAYINIRNIYLCIKIYMKVNCMTIIRFEKFIVCLVFAQY